jgi:ribosomal protein S18 acetylase RimI-like enzyme
MRIFFTKIAGRLESGDTSLRRLSLRHSGALLRGLLEEGLPSSRLSNPFSLWRFLRKTFPVGYCIFAGSKLIGFAGLSGLDAGDSAELSLVIFDRACRGRGHGRRAFKMIAGELIRNSLVRRMFVRLEAGNRAAVFWEKLGFEKTGGTGGLVEMKIGLSPR